MLLQSAVGFCVNYYLLEDLMSYYIYVFWSNLSNLKLLK